MISAPADIRLEHDRTNVVYCSSPMTARIIIAGFHQSIAAFASAGLDLLVEHIVEKASWRADLDRLLLPFDVFWVGMFAPIEELEHRERLRGNRTIGEAREHLATHEYCSYDFSVI
jgi:chloramphenicol 3-O phosphotransferase